MKSIKNRYILVPQMKNYDQITADYEPYTIFFNRKSFKSNNVNTDRYGFRLNYLNGSFKSIYDFDIQCQKKHCKSQIKQHAENHYTEKNLSSQNGQANAKSDKRERQI